MELHEIEKPEDMFYGYYNLRNFLSHTDNAYQLNIGKSLERSLKYRSDGPTRTESRTRPVNVKLNGLKACINF